MSEDWAFLKAICTAPSDLTIRLVYADWLDEQDDPRAAVVRAHVRLLGLSPNDADYLAAWDEYRTLSGTCLPGWVAILEAPVWVVAGNVTLERPSPQAPGGIARGTRLFRPSAKVYLASFFNAFAVLNPTLDVRRVNSIQVIGQHRKSREWIQCYVRADYIAGWRVQLLQQPGALGRLKEATWPGFLIRPMTFEPPEDRTSPEAIQQLLTQMDVASGAEAARQRARGTQ